MAEADAIVVGAGISGLSAATAMGRAGVNVIILDMNTVPGGHAMLAGGPSLVNTSLQTKMGYKDSPDLAIQDWTRWTEGTADQKWLRFYARHSRELVHDWLAEMGVEFVRLKYGNGDSVPRFHFTENGASDMVLALFRTLLEMPNITFEWNQHADNLVVENDRVIGVETHHMRTGEDALWYGKHIVLATGGFEGNLKRVLETWPEHLPEPDRLLIGASRHAKGDGLELASSAGGTLQRLDHHFIYINGLVDPRDPEATYAITADNPLSLWVNTKGKRFTNETDPDKRILEKLLQQEFSSYWMIFDEEARDGFSMRGPEWINTPMEGHPILDDPQVTHKADRIDKLASQIGLPEEALLDSVTRFNAMIESGKDREYGRWGTSEDAPPMIDEPPYYAIQMFPMTRKSMGGVAVDMMTRVLNNSDNVVPGLYAVGELTGSVGINGKYGLDGMFLGPAILTGHLAGRTIAAHFESHQSPPTVFPETPDLKEWSPSLTTVDLRELLKASRREGYWHFQVSHRMVLEREYLCVRCHSAQMPQAPVNNRAALHAKSKTCLNCHN